MREAGKRWLDYQIHEYKKCQREWKWAINNIERKLNLMFVYDHIPIRRDVLEGYVYGFLSNDRKKWKNYWLENNHSRHPDMSNKACEMLSKWWPSLERRVESNVLKELRTLVEQNNTIESPSLEVREQSNKRCRCKFDGLEGSASDSQNHYFFDEDLFHIEPVSS